MEKESKKKNGIGRACSIVGMLLILSVICLCSMLVLPGIFGCHMYNVLSGSMEPEMPVGSLIYVLRENPEDVQKGDVIAFYSSNEDSGIITHRVVNNNVVSGTFQTKGDANAKEDPLPVSYDNYIGSVAFIIPYFGKLFTIMTSLYGKAAMACVVALGIILNFIGSKK